MDGIHLYNLTLQPTGNVSATVVGQFSGARQQEIVVAKGSRLELLRPDTQTGKVDTVLSHDAFGVVRSLAAFRLIGGSKDYLIVGSDSGRIVILEYQPRTNSFDIRRLLDDQVLAESYQDSISQRTPKVGQP